MDSKQAVESAKARIDRSKVAYRKPQPFGMMEDVFLPGALDLDGDEHLWVPQAEGVWFKPLVLCVSQGYYVNLLRVRNSGVLSPSSCRTGPRDHAARPLALSRTSMGGRADELRLRAGG
jgi:hypothetical protein